MSDTKDDAGMLGGGLGSDLQRGLQEGLRDLADATVKSLRQFGKWMHEDKEDAGRGPTHAEISRRSLQAGQIRSALDCGASVGIYGESQAGKSTLVSAFGSALSDRGELLVQAHRGTACVSLKDKLDPGKGGEATGTVCRFVRRDEKRWNGAGPEDHLRVEMLSGAELIASLAMGYHTESARRAESDSDLHNRVSSELQQLRKSIGHGEYEADEHGAMNELLHAWEFLRGQREFTDLRLYEFLDDPRGGQGWDEYLRDECIEKRRRPKDKDLKRFVGLLWCSVQGMTDLWWELRKRQAETLHGASSLWIALSSAEKSGERPSLIDVDLILKEEHHGEKCGVKYVPRGQIVPEGHANLKRWELAALIRCIELPIASNAECPGAPMEVIDFPGARDGKQDDAGFESEDQGVSSKSARKALVRGRVRCLFAQMVDAHDVTSLCLVQRCEGNNDNPDTIRASLRRWLHREGWPRDAGSELPSLVVAMTKFDMVAKSGVEAVRKQLEKIRESYHDPELLWVDKWKRLRGGASSPFQDYFFVHNPKYAQNRFDEAEVREVWDSPAIRELMADPEVRLRAACKKCGGVSYFVEQLRQRTLGSGRPARRLCELGHKLVEVGGKVEESSSFFKGGGDASGEKGMRAEAREHVNYMKQVCRGKPHVLVDFLNILSIRPENVAFAYRSAAMRVAADEDDAYGTLSFENFFDELCSGFRGRLDKFDSSGSPWMRIVGSDRARQLTGNFGQFPKANWFRAPLEQLVGPAIEEADAGAAQIEAIAAVTASIWNRNMAWLGRLPESKGTPEGPPSLRGRSFAAEQFLEHWSKHLPDVYADLVDPAQANKQWNQRLGRIRGDLASSVGKFIDHLGGLLDGESDGEKRSGDSSERVNLHQLRERFEDLRKRLEGRKQVEGEEMVGGETVDPDLGGVR